MSRTWTAKDPNKVVRRGYNWLPALNGATIVASVIAVVEAAGTVLDGQGYTDTLSMATISGGLADQAAVYKITATTSDGETLEATVTLPIVDSATVEPKSQLQTWRDSLFKARLSGIRSVRDQNGEEVTYRSDTEIARALAAADAALAGAQRRPPSTILFRTSKGI